MTMQTSRRSFFGVLAASPLAARKAAADMAARSAGLQVGALGLGGPPMPTAVPASTSKALALLQRIGLPDWFRRRAWIQAKQVYALDPDLACNVSMSLAGKIAVQRQRNYRRLLDNPLGEEPQIEDAASAWRQEHGVWL